MNSFKDILADTSSSFVDIQTLEGTFYYDSEMYTIKTVSQYMASRGVKDKVVPERRGYHASFIHKKKLYIHGGYDIKEGSISSLWSLDIEKL